MWVLNHIQLFVTPWTVACQAPLSMEFSRQEHWSRLPVPSPGNLPDPGVEPVFLTSPEMAGKFFTNDITREAHNIMYLHTFRSSLWQHYFSSKHSSDFSVLSSSAHCQPYKPALVSWGHHNKTPQTGWLKDQKVIFSQFWRLEVHNRHARKLGFCWRIFSYLINSHLLVLMCKPTSLVLLFL